MNVTRGLLTVLSLVCHTESRCSPTSYYKNCWIRRFPGIYIDIEESQRRGAQLLRFYQEESALKCSRTCCLTRNFSCNLAVFHYDTTQENCFHLHCPTLESCILSHRGNVVLYNITKGVDPDLLVFGKYFTSNVRLLPHHYSRGNASEPLPSDKRQFYHPPPPAAPPLTSALTVKPSTTASIPTTSTSTSTSTAVTTTQQSTSQPSTLPSTTAPLSSTPETLLASRSHAQTTTPTTSTTSLAPIFTMPPSSSTASTLSSYNPKTILASSTTTAQPSTSTTHRYTTTSPQLATSPPPSTALMVSVESSKQYPNATKGSLGRNHTAGGDEGQGASGEDTFGGLGPDWHVAAHTLLVAVAICITVLLSCCCSVLLVVSWRGQRKRMGRYRTSWRGKRGSMRLVKYVLVRENS
ncbi:LOW QUALITY PROTEIN: MANSC domain-containing protein 4-like [Anoplopoma fimbria]|uniref:LOW QUALITY PROTEIN: MANSC domain-containing protein 4-like n=1 Tax=Anoplopoma fimbria TaxID=229290 RepID=UPI0023ECC49F|nr:LOW QUALITY PROTEIN: MANSC domain-containing protein 4-like [Anoplopoma fimbria]